MTPEISLGVRLSNYTLLRAGGKAEHFTVARTADQLASIALWAQERSQKMTVLGWGSNVLPSDDGLPGLVILNLAKRIVARADGFVEVETGCAFQDLFLATVQKGLKGFEFAVGIPGTVGGAIVSNAGAYRSNVSEFLTELEVVEGGERRWVTPDWMQFQYRDSRLRQPDAAPCAVVRLRFQLPQGDPKASYDEAREYQRQRIGKQPPQASAGSFFKNVNSHELAERMENLTPGMRKAGVVPAGFLIEKVGLKGFRIGGASFARRHANFILNDRGATATDIRSLALHAQTVVRDQLGVEIEEEVLYLGDWSKFSPIRPA